ncbi:acyltransferase family protein [Enterococcus hulanensis]|uniref:acyltransferase n=1 Tax=Enterococcus hulanensis TaxID=2559929 RepID=UPI00288D14EA|nr:acyltransferase family protein [Enterococcus hulanensis]MDT2662364.1 acyltransferase family protein [Enterococcus hulanensis]
MKSREKKRNIGIDYVKSFACFSVIAVHFRLNIQDKIPVQAFGSKMSLFMSIVYQAFITCVPLFLMATGYLMSKKKWSFSFYVNIFKVVSLYLVCSIFSHYLCAWYTGAFLSIKEIFENILFFKLIPYSGYVEMYLGFVFLFPVINLYIEKTSKKDTKLFILTMVIICSVAPMVNSNPKLNSFLHLPNYWSNVYPILYYLLGAYIKEFFQSMDIKRKQMIILWSIYFSSLLVGIIINYSNANPKVGGTEGYYGSLIVVIQTVSLFLIVINSFKTENKVVTFLSKNTLSIYLMSYSVDQFIYPELIQLIGSPKKLCYMMPIVVILIFILSSVLASFASRINRVIWKSDLLQSILEKLKNEISANLIQSD